FSFVFSCHVHGLYSLFVSFIYRFYVLKHTKPQTQKIVFAFSTDNEPQMKIKVGKELGHEIGSECFTTFHLNEWRLIVSLLYITLSPFPIYIAILTLRRLIPSTMSAQTSMSQRTRQLHSQLLRALTIQACLPVLYVVGPIMQAIEFLNVYNHPLMEYGFVYLLAPIPALNPLVSLYFIGPY
ncbi:hypothetical protein V3C99_001994, partial [Haemonchus contortus]